MKPFSPRTLLAATLLVGTALQRVAGQVPSNSPTKTQPTCNNGCTWFQTGPPPKCKATVTVAPVAPTPAPVAPTPAPVAPTAAPVATPCGSRTAQTCEDDEKCIYNNDKGAKTCSAVSLGTAVEGQVCTATEVVDDDGYYFVDTCGDGFICQLGEMDSTYTVGSPLDGTCAPTTCIGKKVPGNCNGNAPKMTIDQCNATTQRVTICHRTCSEKNPWVRITIDEDAWSGQGCGHQQPSIMDECKKYSSSNWTAWGYPSTGRYKDYLIRDHGTRAQAAVTYNLKNTAAEKAHWRKWEPACPYVRHGACCNWDANECCGTRPATPAPVTPKPVTPAPLAPSPAPVPKCSFDLGETGDTICPSSGQGIITTLHVNSDDNAIIPTGLDPSEIFYDIRFSGTDEAPKVSFKVDNPFDFRVTILVQYHNRPTGSVAGALDPSCIGRPDEPSCDPASPAVQAGCIRVGDDVPFSLVSVFFISENPLFGVGGSGIEPYKCCPIPSGDVDKPMIEYTFKILCGCPDTARHLRQQSIVEGV